MTGFALSIVLAAAFLHAGWNYLLKKSQHKIAFIWCFLLVPAILFFPVFFYFWLKMTISPMGWICIVATGLVHGLYFWFMGGAYERGDLSLVYPLSRGYGPFLVPLLAIVITSSLRDIRNYIYYCRQLYHSITFFSLKSSLEPILTQRSSVSTWASCTGATIASISLVDKVSISLVLPPVVFIFSFLH